jgi:hypothetical protein
MNKKYSAFLILIFLAAIVLPFGASALSTINPYGNGYQGGTIAPTGTPTDLGDPTNGTPTNLGVPTNTGDATSTGIVPTLVPLSLTPKHLTLHMLIDQAGFGGNCQAGASTPTSWTLDPTVAIDTKDKLIQVIKTAEASDTRLRNVHVYDDAIDMYYLQPAYMWGVIPTNYYLHIQTNGNTLRISLEKPKWLGHATNYHAKASSAFVTLVPQYLTPQSVATLEQYDLVSRDAVMIEIVSAVMYQVPVSPISNSFFVCYIVPFFVYILIVFGILIIAVWFLIRRFKKKSGFEIKRVVHLEEELMKETSDELNALTYTDKKETSDTDEDDPDNEYPSGPVPPVAPADEPHTTSFNIPKH